MKKQITVLAVMLFAVVALFSCKKETYVQDSTAVSLYANVSPGQWSLSTDGTFYYYDVSTTKLGNFDFTIDGTLVYGGPSTQSGVGDYMYPLMGNGTLIDGLYYYYDIATDGSVRIYAQNSNGNAVRPTTYMYFNLIFVRPTTDLGQAHINTNNYSEVKQFFNLK